MLVFEDLHWADEAMLAFLEHLADLAEGVPLLFVGTARPELYERHPGLRSRAPQRHPDHPRPALAGGDRPPGLGPAGGGGAPAELQQPILDRAGGNPLYAEEFVRLLNDRDLLVRVGPSWQLRKARRCRSPIRCMRSSQPASIP